jgi:hypothetical protein
MMSDPTYNRDNASAAGAAAHRSDRGEPFDRQDSERSVSSVMQLAQRQHEEFLVARRRRQLPAAEEPPAPPMPAPSRVSLREDPAIQLPGLPPRTSKRFPKRLNAPTLSDPNGNGHANSSEATSPPSPAAATQQPQAPRRRPVDVQRTEPDDQSSSPEDTSAYVMRITCDKCGDVVRVDKFATIFQCPRCSTLNYAGSQLVSPVPRPGAASPPRRVEPSSSVGGVSI